MLGPPGSGKTHFLMGELEKELERGTSPDKIGLITFTKRAANEARNRAMEKFKLAAADLPYFRTLHSLAFRQLGLSRTQVMGRRDYDELGDITGQHFTGTWSLEAGTISLHATGDRMLFMENLSRVGGVALRTLYDRDDDNLSWVDLQRTAEALLAYKQARYVYDFTDMIRMFVNQGEVPLLDALFIDEAQDLSPLQWQMVNRLKRDVDRVTVAGDDDQAIFRWAGADVDYFVELAKRAAVLGRSYRVPAAVQAFANEIIGRVENRKAKQWQPRADQGEVRWHTNIEQVDFAEGEFLVLTRNAYQLAPVERLLREDGYLYEVHEKSSVAESILQAILGWERMRRGERISQVAAAAVLENTTLGGGLPDQNELSAEELGLAPYIGRIWHEGLDRIPPAERDYMIAALRRGEKLTRRPRIRLSTIHGAKGGQAEQVVLFMDMAPRTFQYMHRYPDDEARVFYVGATRTKDVLHVVQPKTKYHFSL